jgi:hypothetical protein
MIHLIFELSPFLSGLLFGSLISTGSCRLKKSSGAVVVLALGTICAFGAQELGISALKSLTAIGIDTMAVASGLIVVLSSVKCISNRNA